MKIPVHQKIRLLRKAKELSQENMAFELNLSVGAYSNIERGSSDINLKKLERICEILDVTLSDLLHYQEDDKIKGDGDTITFLNNKINDLEKELNHYKMLLKFISGRGRQ